MSDVLTLPALRKFALLNPETRFDLADDRRCLACQAAGPGHVMTGWTYFSPAPVFTQVDVRYAALCRELDGGIFTGRELARMIRELEHGVHPRQVADEQKEGDPCSH